MYTFQCEGLQMGQSNGVRFKEVSALSLWRCPLIRGFTVYQYTLYIAEKLGQTCKTS